MPCPDKHANTVCLGCGKEKYVVLYGGDLGEETIEENIYYATYNCKNKKLIKIS